MKTCSGDRQRPGSIVRFDAVPGKVGTAVVIDPDGGVLEFANNHVAGLMVDGYGVRVPGAGDGAIADRPLNFDLLVHRS
jgi:hypothetical protein